MFRRTTNATTAALLAVALLGACSSDDTGAPDETTTSADATTTTAPPEPLQILVTNDDGIGAPGIDAVVTALEGLPDVEITIVAPAENQSGSSDKTTPGGAPYEEGVTASGVVGTAVQGFPADTIAVALDELGLEPDVVVSGVNEGQNVGPLTPLSGTVGAARTALRRGIPSVAGSAGLEGLADFDLGAQLVADWVAEHRDELVDGTAQTDTVTSFNVPGCKAGEPKEVLEVEMATEIPEGLNVFETADCSVEPATPPTDDVLALAGGHSAVTQVPADL